MRTCISKGEWRSNLVGADRVRGRVGDEGARWRTEAERGERSKARSRCDPVYGRQEKPFKSGTYAEHYRLSNCMGQAHRAAATYLSRCSVRSHLDELASTALRGTTMTDLEENCWSETVCQTCGSPLTAEQHVLCTGGISTRYCSEFCCEQGLRLAVPAPQHMRLERPQRRSADGS
jgi:hypothetical protein